MSGHVGDLSSEQEEKLEQFRKAVNDCLPPDHDDYYLLRWLRARKFDVKSAEVMLRKSLEWRRLHGIDNILDNEFPEVLKKGISQGLIGYSKDGCPIWLFAHAYTDFKGLLRSVRRSDAVKGALYHVEKALQELKQQNQKSGKNVETFIVIHDFENTSISTFTWKPVMETLMEAFKRFDENYPERLKKAFIINCPRFIHVLYSVIRPFIAEETAKKIVFFSSGWKEALLEEIDASELPQHWGGTKVDPDGDPKCPSLIHYGAPVPPSYYMNLTENLMKKNPKSAVISQRSVLPVELSIEQPGCTIKWEFITKNYDIFFGVFRRKENQAATSHKENSDLEEIYPLQKVYSHLVPEKGAIQCDVPGTYILKFDNSFSWIHPKRLLYDIEVVLPKTDGDIQSTTFETRQIHEIRN